MITEELKAKINFWLKENPWKSLWDAFENIEEIEKIELNNKENAEKILEKFENDLKIIFDV